MWDGDQILHEISAPASGAGMEQDVPPMRDSFLGPHHYGRVMYVHGGGIDQPIAVVRSEYSDSLHTGSVYPLANHKGQYDMGISTCVLVTPRSPMLTEHHGEQQIGTDTVTHQIGDTTPYEHCVRVEWPGRRSFSSGYRRHSWGPAPPWVGSLLYHGKDPSGQMYRRNRFYDPSSGRFTQEDPIGIAGGLNVYGYANGDPITYVDPFGLSASCDPPKTYCPRPSPADWENVARRTGEKLEPVGPALNVAGAVAVGSLAVGIGAIAAAELGGISMLGLSVTVMRAAPGAPMFGIASSAADKIGHLASQTGLTPANIVQGGINTAKWIDHANRGNIQGFLAHPQYADRMIRVSFDPEFTRVISAGIVRSNQVQKWITNGRLEPYLLTR